MAGIVRQFTAWLLEHTYAVVFLSALVDATALPFPGRIVLAAAGAFAAAGEANVGLVIALGTAGVVIGDHVWYCAGSLGGGGLLRLYCRLTFTSPDCAQRTTDWFQRFGPWTIVVGRFVAAVRVLAWPLARDQGIGYATFLGLDLVAALVWTAIWVGLGWLLGGRWMEAPAEIRWISIALTIAAAASLLVARWWRRRRLAATEPSSAPPVPRGIGGRVSRGSPAIPRARPRP